VFVLLPGGTFLMGGQPVDPQRPNYDPATPEHDPPRNEVVPAVFLARHELTQGQWRRLDRGAEPSRHKAGDEPAPPAIDLRHPVESVDWHSAGTVLERYGLRLPDEVEWEYACRAGTTTRWWSGAERQSLLADGVTENFADQAAARAGARWPDIADWPELDDGFCVHAPIGSFRANPWGFHDMHGNVAEWTATADPGDVRVVRGGNFLIAAAAGGSARRYRANPDHREFALGVRAARSLR